jgi:undecaprenyl-diphosphatase
LKGYIARPRPSAAAMSPGAVISYSMPSGWALLFGSTVGFLGVLALRHARGTIRAAYVTGCALVLVAGLCARVVLNAHWPSDVIAGYLLAVAIALAVNEALANVKGKGQRA